MNVHISLPMLRQLPPAPLERDRARHTAAQPQRHDEPPIRGELLQPRHRHSIDTHGGDDPVVRRAVRIAERSVAEDDPYVLEARRCESRPGTGHDVVVHVDRGDLAAFTGQMREQARVVSRAGTQLHDPLTGFDLELFEHHRDDLRL